MDPDVDAASSIVVGGASDGLVGAVSQLIASGQADTAAARLLEDRLQPEVVLRGWDLLALFTPHLPSPSPPPPSPSPIWRLVDYISSVCPAKEMSLALLEGMAATDQRQLSTSLRLLRPLKGVLLQLQNDSAVASSLSGAARMVRAGYHRLSGVEGGGHAHPSTDQEEGEEEEEEEGGGEPILAATLSAASQILQFVEPFIERYCHSNHSPESPVLPWSSVQTVCASLLLSLLAQPLVTFDLGSGDSKATAELVMAELVRCRCGALQLMEREGGGRKEEEGWPALGQACFCFLLLCEGLQRAYLPHVISPAHLLHCNLRHCRALLGRPERYAAKKGLSLLHSLTSALPRHSLPLHLLDDTRYQDTAELMAGVMVSNSHYSVRKASVPAMMNLIGCFCESGRHRLFRGLLRVVPGGPAALLTHALKEEVDTALKSSCESQFLGPALAGLTHLCLSVAVDTDLLRDMDRVMAALNLLRYLLIRDKPSSNRTHVWSQLGQLRSRFTEPLREALQTSRLQCRQHLATTQDPSLGAKVTVEVGGALLPALSPQEQRQVLLAAEQRFDLLECVLVRVEELLDQPLPPPPSRPPPPLLQTNCLS